MTETTEEKQVEKPPEPKPITRERLVRMRREFLKLRNSLEYHHALFYELCCMGAPIFSHEIPTSGVQFHPKYGGYLAFMWNPDFWDECDDYKKVFVTCHEILHVMLSHGKRMDHTPGIAHLSNMAADIVINHLLVDFFGFDREQIEGSEDLCWIDTVFKDNKEEIEETREYEYYFQEIKKIATVVQVLMEGGGGQILDSHDSLPDSSDCDGKSTGQNEGLKDTIKKVVEQNLTKEERKDFHDKCAGKIHDTSKDPSGQETSEDREAKTKLAGTIAGDTCYIILPKKQKYNMKWTEVINNWRRRRQHEEGPEDIWHQRERKFNALSPEIMLPYAKDADDQEQEYIDVWFYQDISGSCVHMAEKFFSAARTFPPTKFNVRAFSFDTRVHPIDLKEGKVRGGGGTAFIPIEESIQKIMVQENCKYPDAVFVFTDGYSWDHVQPQHPKRWYWFLNEGGTKDYIPVESNVFKLSDFSEDI
jgi:predicted metal-dependent peptidase